MEARRMDKRSGRDQAESLAAPQGGEEGRGLCNVTDDRKTRFGPEDADLRAKVEAGADLTGRDVWRLLRLAARTAGRG